MSSEGNHRLHPRYDANTDSIRPESHVAKAQQKTPVTPPGVVALYIIDGRVIATATAFERDRHGGFTVLEAQQHRAKSRLCVEVVRALASPALATVQDGYDCEQIVRRMKGEIQLVAVGEHTAE